MSDEHSVPEISFPLSWICARAIDDGRFRVAVLILLVCYSRRFGRHFIVASNECTGRNRIEIKPGSLTFAANSQFPKVSTLSYLKEAHS